jgi:hypothetical protein
MSAILSMEKRGCQQMLLIASTRPTPVSIVLLSLIIIISDIGSSVSQSTDSHTYPDHPRSYENPFVTATSRSVIGDIHRLSRQLSSVDVPRPLAVLCTLFRIRPSNHGFLGQYSNEALFQALRVWTDVGDICENESFGGCQWRCDRDLGHLPHP